MKQEIINEIRKALEQATPGPWREGALNIWSDEDVLLLCNLGQGVRYWYDGGMRIYRQKDSEQRTFADSHLIPLLRNHAPALLDEIDRLTARVKELEACRNKTCTWKPYREHRKKDNMLKTSCGYVSCNSERYGNYCPYCGGKIEEDES